MADTRTTAAQVQALESARQKIAYVAAALMTTPLYDHADRAQRELEAVLAALQSPGTPAEPSDCHHCGEQPPSKPCWWCGRPGTAEPSGPVETPRRWACVRCSALAGTAYHHVTHAAGQPCPRDTAPPQAEPVDPDDIEDIDYSGGGR